MSRLFLAALLIPGFGLAQQTPTMNERVRPLVEHALAAGDSFATVSAASGAPLLAAEELASAFGPNLAAQSAVSKPPFQTSVGGIALQVVDSAGTQRLAPLLYTSPSQINFIVPAGTASGMAKLNITNGTGVVLSASANIQTVAPSLFSANSNGLGVAAATAYRTPIPTTLAIPVPVYQCASAGQCASVPLDVGVDSPVTVTLYGTGLKNRAANALVTLTVGSQTIPVRVINSGDATSALAGIDRITFGLQLSLRGSGEVDVKITVDGQTSNAVRLNIL